MKKYNLGLYEKAMPNSLTMREKLEYAKKAGFDFLEMSVDETDEKLARLDYDKTRLNELLLDTSKVGLPIESMCLSGHRKYPLGSPDKEIEARSLEIMEKAIKLASYLGIRVIQLAGYDIYYGESTEETVIRFEENLEKAVHMAATHSVMLAFETMETPFMDTVEKAMYYVNKVNSPYLHVYPDSGNITNASLLYGKDVKEDLLSGKGHVSNVHLKETVPGKYREIPFGTGHVDFDKIINTSLDMGVRRFVTELWHTDDDWYEHIVFANKMMSEIIENYFKTEK